jgi:hypothetical protein
MASAPVFAGPANTMVLAWVSVMGIVKSDMIGQQKIFLKARESKLLFPLARKNDTRSHL